MFKFGLSQFIRRVPTSRIYPKIVPNRKIVTLQQSSINRYKTGNYIPLAHNYSKPYQYFRNVKLGNVDWLKYNLEQTTLSDTEKTELIQFINKLKIQPYSLQNFVSSAAFIGIPIKLYQMYFSYMAPIRSFFYGMLSQNKYLGFLGLTVESTIGIGSFLICAMFVKYGMTLLINEIRSPFYKYDEMENIVKNSKQENVIS